MPSLFSRLKGRDGATKAKSKKQAQLDQLAALSQKPRWDDAWTRTTVEPYEIQELVRLCKEELKARGMISIRPPRADVDCHVCFFFHTIFIIMRSDGLAFDELILVRLCPLTNPV